MIMGNNSSKEVIPETYKEKCKTELANSMANAIVG